MGTAVEAGTKVVMVLWNNRGYGEIKSYMEQALITPLGVDIHTPDFRLLASGYGWAYAKAEDFKNFRSAITDAIALDRPTVIEVDELSLVRSTAPDAHCFDVPRRGLAG